MAADPVALISRKTGDWWQDHRRNWCAYCGSAIDFGANKPGKPSATRDHVIAKAHGGTLKIPSCIACNAAKGKQSLPEFLNSRQFADARKKAGANFWPLRDLWLALAMAAVHLAKRHSDEWPGDHRDPGRDPRP